METLEGKLITLRPLEPSDLDILYLWENNPENWQVSQTITPFSKKVLLKYLENSNLDIFQIKQLRMVICLSDTKRPIGFIDLFDFDPFHQRAGIGILIGDQEDRDKGYAGAALESLLNYCFSILMLNQVHCNILKSNDISQKLFLKAGFEHTGTRKSWIRSSNGWLDEYQYQLLHQDWLSTRS